MTTTFHGFQAVPAGYYLDTERWAIEPVAADGDRLPAGSWRRVPTALALLAAPFAGLAFLLFLPIIGILVSLKAAFAPVFALASGSAGDLAATVSPGWQPGEAHFTGTKRNGNEGVESQGPPAEEDVGLAALQREIERRRGTARH